MSWLHYMSWTLSLGLLLLLHAVSSFKMSKRSLELQSKPRAGSLQCYGATIWNHLNISTEKHTSHRPDDEKAKRRTDYGWELGCLSSQTRLKKIPGSDSIWRLEIIIFTRHTLWLYLPTVITNQPRLEQTQSQLKPNHIHNGIDSHYRHKSSVIFRLKCKPMKTQKNKQRLISATRRQKTVRFSVLDINNLHLFVTSSSLSVLACQACASRPVIPNELAGGLHYQPFSSGHGCCCLALLAPLWVWFEPKKEPQDTTSEALAFSAVTPKNFRSR